MIVLFIPKQSTINTLIKYLEQGFLLKDEGDVLIYLNIQIRKDDKAKQFTSLNQILPLLFTCLVVIN